MAPSGWARGPRTEPAFGTWASRARDGSALDCQADGRGLWLRFGLTDEMEARRKKGVRWFIVLSILRAILPEASSTLQFCCCKTILWALVEFP